MKKQFHLCQSNDFQQVMKNKKFFASKGIVIYLLKTENPHVRIGISASKKLGNAVVRNKVKRQIRMMVDELISFDQSLDIVIVARNGFIEQPFEKNKQNLQQVLKKGNVN